MMPNKSGMYSLESLVPTRDPSTPVLGETQGSIGDVGRVGGVPVEDAEYEEVDDLIYERTGTLSFPYPLRIVETGVRATEAAGARPETTAAPSVGSEGSAWSSLGRRVRDLRVASAGTPGVSILATVDVIGGIRAHSPSSTSHPRAPLAPPSLPQRRGGEARSPAPAPHFKRTTQPSLRAKQRVDPSREREARFAPVPNAKRTTQPSLRAKEHPRRVYPSFGQRVLAEVRRSPLAKRGAASGVVAALVVVAGVFVASSTIVTRRVPKETVASRASVAFAERAAVPALAHVEPRVSVIVADEAPPQSPNASDGELPKEAKPNARSNRRGATLPIRREPCDCLPGDPLCGCLD